MTRPSQESHERKADKKEAKKKTQPHKATSARLTASAHNPDADVLIRHFNGPVWSRGDDTVSAFFSSSYLYMRVASVC